MSLRTAVLRVLVGASLVTGAVALLALLRGDLSDTDARVIGTSLAFSLATTLGAAGVAAATAPRGGPVALVGRVTVAATALGFVGLVVAIWADPYAEAAWRVLLCLGIVALEGAHASYVLARRRTTDSTGARAAGAVALTATALSTVATLVPAAVPIDPSDGDVETYGKLLAVVLVVQLVATVVGSLLRRLGGPAPERPLLAPEEPLDVLRSEVLAAAARIESVTREERVLSEAARLRVLARPPAG